MNTIRQHWGKTELFMTFKETKCTAYTLFKINVFQSNNGNKIKLLSKWVVHWVFWRSGISWNEWNVSTNQLLNVNVYFCHMKSWKRNTFSQWILAYHFKSLNLSALFILKRWDVYSNEAHCSFAFKSLVSCWNQFPAAIAGESQPAWSLLQAFLQVL